SHEVATGCSHWREPMEIERHEIEKSRRDGRSCDPVAPLGLGVLGGISDPRADARGYNLSSRWD
ncbi:hypothetical protein, partial [Rhodopirellula europaea]